MVFLIHVGMKIIRFINVFFAIIWYIYVVVEDVL